MLTIRLSRTGKHKAPQYRVVVQQNHRDPWSPAIEIIGHYNPRRTPSEVVLKTDRVEYWLSQGAVPSNTVHNILVNEGLLKADKKDTVTISNKRNAKITEKRAAEEEARLAAEEAKKAAAEAAKAEAEAAKEAAKAEAEAAKAAAEAPAAEEVPAEATETPAE
jgi:small subunit ribosomal protein S16